MSAGDYPGGEIEPRDLARGAIDRHAENLKPRRILGSIHERHMRFDREAYMAVESDFRKTDDPSVLAYHDGTEWRAVGRWCAHQGLDLAREGYIQDGKVGCFHAGYSWECTSGTLDPCPKGDAIDMVTTPIASDEDGLVWANLPTQVRRKRGDPT